MIQSVRTSLSTVAAHYIRLLKVKVTESSIKRSVEENPHYPSLLSLTETFDHYRISNKTFSILPENLDNLEPPFIAFINIPDIENDFVLVTKIDGSTISYLHKSGKTQVVSKNEFLSKYLNIVWIAEPDEQSGENDYYQNLRREHKIRNSKILWIAGVILLMSFAFAINFTAVAALSFTGIMLLKFTGLTLTIFLLIYENDKSNAFVKSICTAKKQLNCDAVLNSKASKIMGLSWSEIGFFYFCTTTLWLLFPLINLNEKIIWIALSNAIASPYILFSVYYQWRIAKQWCILCLSVQGILFLELCWSYINFWSVDRPGIGDYIVHGPYGIMLIPFLILSGVALAWIGFKTILRKAKNADSYRTAYKRLHYNQDIFQGILLREPQAPDGWQHLGIDLGDANASNVITKVCDPYCTPCAKAHPFLEEIINRNEDFKLKIIFTASNDTDDKSAPIVKHLLSIAAEGDMEKTKKALNEWYLSKNKDFNSFAEKYKVIQNDKAVNEIAAMRNWCDKADITFTPTIFLNGYLMPEDYNPEELKNIY
jgi:uncharacterized membrane protein